MKRFLSNTRWELAEKVSVYRKLREPKTQIILQQMDAKEDDNIVAALLRLDFRSRVLDELERFHPSILIEATAAVLKGGGTPESASVTVHHDPPTPHEGTPGLKIQREEGTGKLTCQDDGKEWGEGEY